MKLNIDGITEIDDFYFTPRCDMMQIYIRDKNGFQGPYCDNSGRVEAESFQKQESDITKMLSRSPRSIEGRERSKRVRRGSNGWMSWKKTGFQGDEIDLVFVKNHNSYRFTFGFEFTWELLNTEVGFWPDWRSLAPSLCSLALLFRWRIKQNAQQEIFQS